LKNTAKHALESGLCTGFFRHPLVMFTFGPLYIFAISNRFASKNASKKQRQSVVLTNLTLMAITAILCLTIGWPIPFDHASAHLACRRSGDLDVLHPAPV